MAQRILAIASGGGHWQQLNLLRPAFEGHDVFYIATLPGLPQAYGAEPAAVVSDCNRNKPLAAVLSVIQITGHVMRLRPHVVITTGALPGLIGLALGRLIGARTVWIDSVANAEKLSMSGAVARRIAHLCLSQWEHVAREAGVDYAGSVL